MKVAHLEFGRHLYGGAGQVRALMAGLAREQVSNVLVCPQGSAIAAVASDAELIAVPVAGDLDLRLPGRLARILRQVNPDLVHVHSRRGAELFGAVAARRAGDRPGVVTRRIDSVEPRAWLRLKYRPYRAVIAISRAIEAMLLERAGLSRAQVHLVPSGVDTERFRPDRSARARLIGRFELPGDALILGVAAQLIARKGHDVLLECLPGLLRRHPTLVALLFGRGPLEPALRKEIAARGLGRHVRLAGFCDDFDRCLPGLDLLVHPALREGLGLVLLEALSCGVPVIASAAGGIVDVIGHDEHGLLVAPGNPAQLGAALQRLIVDPALRRRLGERGRRHVEAGYSSARMVAGNVAVYEGVLGRRLTGSPHRDGFEL